MPEETTQQATGAPSSRGSKGKGSAQAKQGGRGGGPALGVKVATSNGDPAKKPRSPALGRPCAYCKEAGHHINKCAKLIAKKAADGVGTADGMGTADGDATKEGGTKEAAEKKQYPCAYCKEVGHHINSCQKLATKKAQQPADGAQTLPSRAKGPDQGNAGPLNAVEPYRSLEHPSEDVPTTLAPSLIPMGPREGTPMGQSEGVPAHSPMRRRDGPPSANGVGPQAPQGIEPSAPKIKITYTREDEEDAMQIPADSTQKRRISGLGLSATAPAYHSARRSEATSPEQVPPTGKPSGAAEAPVSCMEEAAAPSRPEASEPKASKGKGKGKAREPRGNGAGVGEEKGDRKAGKGERGKGDGSRGRGGDGRMRARGAAHLPAAPTTGGGASVAPPPGLRVVMPQEECDEAAIVKAKEEAEGRAAEAAAEAAEAEAEAARARETRLAAEREVARLDAEAAEAKLETERRRAEAEAAEQERRKQMNQKVARAGTAFAALLMDSDMDEESSEEEEPAATPPPSNGASKAGRGRAAKEQPKAKPPPPDDRQPAPPAPAPAPAAPPRPPTPPPVWWGSEEHDAAQRFPLKLTTASHSKAGDTRIHANEDRYTMLVDLDAHLAKGDEPLEGPAAASSPPNSFFAVYDGHGGAGASTHAANRLHLHLNSDADSWRLSPQDALLRAFTLTEAELRHTYDAVGEGKGRDKSGTCALVALLRGSRLFVGGLGDCRALLVRGDGHAQPFVQLTTDQRATESGEQARILKAGGQITDGRVWGALIPSRTLGDFPWKDRGPGLSATPDISAHEISPDDKYLIMGSDGLFDVLSNKTIARIAGKMSSGAVKVCNELVKELRKRPGTDDVTLLVVQLGR